MVEAARERGLDAHGVDVDPVSIDYARRHYPRGTLHAGTIEQLSDALGSFDLVYCSEVIEHVPHARAFISALAAITKPGGYLFLTTPDVYRTPSAFHDPGHCVFYERRGLIGAMRLAGLRHVLTIPQVKPGLKVLFRR